MFSPRLADESSDLDASAGRDAAEIRDASRDAAPDAGFPDANEPADTGLHEDAGAEDSTPIDASEPDAGNDDAGPTGWPRPACATIQGTNGVTFSLNEGRTLAPTAGMLSGVAYTYGLVALDTPGVLLAVHDDELIRSTDSGCTWTSIGPLAGGFPLRLAAAGATRAYAWADNNRELYRIDGTTITPLTSPVDNIKGLAVDRSNPDHFRIAGGDGQIHESTTGGTGRFATVGLEAFPGNGLVYRVVFDPTDFSRAIAGAASDGARWTDDSGMTWNPVAGLSTIARGRANIFEAAYSPASPDVVWFEGIDLEENLAGAPGEGRHIWYSNDGGRTARPVLTRTASITLINGNLLVPHPTEANILYFVFGTYFQGYGTDIYRFDVATNNLTINHNNYQDVNAIEFAPGDPQLMFLGLTNER